jgi:TPR repeat protein
MISTYTTWRSAHGRLWYDDKWYRCAWLVWPQALSAVLVLLLWAMPASVRNVPWAKPVDAEARNKTLAALRDTAKSSRQAMDALEREALAGEMHAQFFYATLFDPDLKLSTIVQPDVSKAVDWYAKAATQGEEISIGNLALTFARGLYVRQDYTRACFHARKLSPNASANALNVKGDCYARGLGGTPADLDQAASAYEGASNKGNIRAAAALGYFYENGVGGKPRNYEMALKLYRAAADKNDSLGLHNLGWAYNSGLLGLQRDGGEAARLIVRALENKYDVTVQSLTTRSDLWTGDFWQSLQRRLGEKGLYSAAIDGRPNSATLDAVRRLAGRG